MKLKLVAGFALFVGLVAADNRCVLACSCKSPGPPRESLAKAVSVFSGKVTKVEAPNRGSILSGDDPVFITFEVTRIWKGAKSATVVAQTATDGAACGFSFKQGAEYIVYGYGTEARPQVSLCSRTALLADASEDLKVLGEGERPVRK